MPSDWDRIARDPALLADVRRRYSGRGDVLDQLWWIQHPGEVAPSGRADPEEALAAARRALYRQGVRPEEALAAIADASRWIEDRALAKLAVLDALGALGGPVAEGAPVTAPPAAAGALPSTRRRAALLLGGIAAAALLVGALAGRASVAGVPTGAGRAFAVLRSAQRPADRVAAALRPGFVDGRSTRLLARYGTIGTSVYAARGGSGEVCLLTVVLDVRVAGACTTEAAFSSAGLLVAFRASADPADDSGRLPRDDLGVVWKADGTLRIRS